MRFRLLIEYEGTAYFGWQIQNGQRTVQGEIESSLHRILGDKTSIIGAGRTDTGVHASGQTAHFDYSSELNTLRLQRSLNGVLNNDIRIKEIQSVDDSFHARFSAILREYHYNISRQPDAFMRNLAWNLTYPLNIDNMNEAAALLLGRHNFGSFCKIKSAVNHHFCDIHTCEWKNKGDLLVFIIKADRFLHGMVRSIVGTLVDIGRAKLDISAFKIIINARSRPAASQAAPARGLILEKVYY